MAMTGRLATPSSGAALSSRLRQCDGAAVRALAKARRRRRSTKRTAVEHPAPTHGSGVALVDGRRGGRMGLAVITPVPTGRATPSVWKIGAGDAPGALENAP
jgi:hypothetical protein